MLVNFTRKTALFSDCQKYRFHLSREWDVIKPSICWILLNPSTADENVLDNTLTRCLDYSVQWGFGSMHITNIFAFRATDPKNMMAAKDPVGPDNDGYLTLIPRMCELTVAGWGNGGLYLERWKEIEKLTTMRDIKLKCLRKTKSGQPSHPLYLPKDLELIDWP
jgi:hypothetical protein